MKKEGISFKHAVELLRDGVMPDSEVKPVARAATQKSPSVLVSNSEEQALLNRVVDFYHQALKKDTEGLAYLEKRGISAEAIDHFKLGLANRTLGYRLPEKTRKEGAAIRGQLQRVGILRESGHEHFNGSIVIPVVNQGHVLEIYGRKMALLHESNIRRENITLAVFYNTTSLSGIPSAVIRLITAQRIISSVH